MAEDLPPFRHQVVLVTRDFCPRLVALWGAVLLFISYVWISKKSYKAIHNSFLDIHKSFLDIQKMNLGYHKIIMDIQKMYFRI